MNVKLVAATIVVVTLAGIGFATFGLKALRDYGQERYDAGYAAHVAELSQAKAQADQKAHTLERSQNEDATRIDALLRENSRLSGELAGRIRRARFDCGNLGPEFVELFNAGARGAHTDQLEAGRPAHVESP